MAGLSSIGVYLPRGRHAERSVAQSDEDTFTMAVEAAHRCLEETEPLTFGGLFFASVTSPAREMSAASAIATACDLPRDIVTADFGGSVRAGLSALTAAVRAIDGGLRKVLVVASDCRRAGLDPAGDGAAAAVVDAKARLCGFLGTAAVAEDFAFQSASPGPLPDERLALRDLAEVVERVINESGVGADQIAALALGGVGPSLAMRLAEMVGIDPEQRLVASLRSGIGALGVPEPLFQLARGLEAAHEGDRLVVAASAGGAEALLLEAGPGAGEAACRPSVRAAVGRHRAHDGVSVAPLAPRSWDGAEPADASPPTAPDVPQLTRLYGTRCATCGVVQFPAADSCARCGTREGLEPAKLAKQGRVAALGRAAGDVVVELDDGARVPLEVTDDPRAELEVASPVQLTLRRATSGVPYRYAWKARSPD